MRLQDAYAKVLMLHGFKGHQANWLIVHPEVFTKLLCPDCQWTGKMESLGGRLVDCDCGVKIDINTGKIDMTGVNNG